VAPRARAARAALLACVLAWAGCGGGGPPRQTSATSAPRGPVFGLSEDNAQLLWSPSARNAPDTSEFLASRRELTALHPRYIRLVVDWATFEPRGDEPADLSLPIDGCARGVAPCGAFAGIAGEPRARKLAPALR
jgi:hypothetical protein